MNKTIHYCWFGKKPKPKLIKKCIDSWRKYCPDYTIIEWNEDNFDIKCCDYVREAYESKKWAFVSDYCRFYVLYHQGGIYLDTDVELLKSLDGFKMSFVGFENADHVASGLIRGAEKEDFICQEMLHSYQNDHFIMKDGSLNLKTVCIRETDILSKYGLKKNNLLQIIKDTTIYPSEYFNPTDMETGRIKISDNTVSIHHYAASWTSKKEKIRGKIYYIICKVAGKKAATRIRKIIKK